VSSTGKTGVQGLMIETFIEGFVELPEFIESIGFVEIDFSEKNL
jgi:hypothetical protein